MAFHKPARLRAQRQLQQLSSLQQMSSAVSPNKASISLIGANFRYFRGRIGSHEIFHSRKLMLPGCTCMRTSGKSHHVGVVTNMAGRQASWKIAQLRRVNNGEKMSLYRYYRPADGVLDSKVWYPRTQESMAFNDS